MPRKEISKKAIVEEVQRNRLRESVQTGLIYSVEGEVEQRIFGLHLLQNFYS
ncbi:hypothetical protein Cflav_PD4673 [Pedosphaera parvula Ellin514]|uniref:Uncharacterized protein n=1 Tax=Pedosphaera parvula (strain Ellin514) TaxID=320771 RepID=B9XEB9_PEDPL|nr:hypothetical protein Cflav_PD4673 [Pedosphaera parvula Ellin514]